MEESMKIVVLGGGISTERQVSLVTSASVCRALRECGHQAVFVDMFLGLEDYDGPLEELFNMPDGHIPIAQVSHTAPDLKDVIASRSDKSPSRIGKNVLEICRLADIVFLGLHGEDGEDGKIQATLDLLGVKYTGSGPLGSAMAMNKAVAKRIMMSEGILTPGGRSFVYTREDIPGIVEQVKLPCVVKAVTGGSSIGVEMAGTAEELKTALERVIEIDNRVVIEDRITGREFTVPVLGDRALDAIEIIPPEGSGSFDYVSKYQSGSEAAREICPADITPEQQKLMGTAALKLHRALGLSVYSRTDFILDRDNRPWCLEINTLPGMTPASLIPRSAKVAGMDYNELCEKIIELSLAGSQC